MVEYAMNHAWLIPLLPTLAFVAIIFLTRPWPLLSALIAVGAMLTSCFFATFTAIGVFTSPELTEKPLVYAVNWFNMPGMEINVGILLDPVSAMMMFMVTLVGSLIFIYAIGYMQDDPGYSVFFSYVSLFAAFMLLLVASSSLVEMFVGWEGVGLCSYLLIGFYQHKISAREAAKKAFITCRVADFGLLLGMLLLFWNFGTLDFAALAEKIPHFQQYNVSAATLALIAFLVFCGPIGKSGQFPLHVWLPDAMEGPTPVSALIHAATMVVAGVYLVARVMFLFHEVPSVMQLVAVTGGFTALFAATIAVTQREIKRILAYSTISQIGYMMLALGVGSLTAGMFHLWTHAFFKALLFLGAGSVLVALHHKADVWEMGGLLKKMPITGWTFLVGCIAIAGIPPFAGFWSKDEILLATLESGHYVLFAMAAFTAFLTAFYMFRLFFLAFTGAENPANHPKESPWVMTVPLIFLAIFSLVGGWVGTPWANVWSEWIFFGHPHHGEPNYMVMIGSVVLAGLGIYLAYYFYCADREKVKVRELARRYQGIYTLLYNKYYIDEIYLWLNHTLVDGAAKIFYLFDIYVVDGIIVNGVAAITGLFGEGLRVTATGRLQNYALVFFLGVLAVFVVLAFTSPLLAGPIWGGVR
ncbi:MAG: NADH-quinone oxidoreductase subunit L [Armatimonadetes bacterium]|nr:NADH-quinone oxidoreductase subunit L [Armatimonadota bacterium]